jgi:hypothetical protein
LLWLIVDSVVDEQVLLMLWLLVLWLLRLLLLRLLTKVKDDTAVLIVVDVKVVVQQRTAAVRSNTGSFFFLNHPLCIWIWLWWICLIRRSDSADAVALVTVTVMSVSTSFCVRVRVKKKRSARETRIWRFKTPNPLHINFLVDEKKLEREKIQFKCWIISQQMSLRHVPETFDWWQQHLSIIIRYDLESIWILCLTYGHFCMILYNNIQSVLSENMSTSSSIALVLLLLLLRLFLRLLFFLLIFYRHLFQQRSVMFTMIFVWWMPMCIFASFTTVVWDVASWTRIRSH